MKRENRSTMANARGLCEVTISRRAALGASTVGLLGLLSGSALAGEQDRDPDREAEARAAGAALAEQMRLRMEQQQSLADRMRDAGSEEERRQIMDGQMQMMRERAGARNQRAIDNLKEQLRVSDTEWQVVRPRLEAVYNLVRPMPQIAGQDASARSELDKAMQELREVLADEDADAATIKARLTAVRTAKERANQRLAAAQKDLRQLMTLRQEAILVLNGLLD